MRTNFMVVASLALVGCQGQDGADGMTGMPGMNGVNGTDGTNGTNGTNGAAGADGLHCWDLNGDGVEDAAEDINNDAAWDTLDCQPAIGREVITGSTTLVMAFQQTLNLTCPTGKLPYGGGHSLVAANNSVNVDAMVTVSRPTANGWMIHAHGDNAGTPAYTWRIDGWVICGN